MDGCELPTELLKHIMSYLEDEDIYRCSGTCRLWYHVANWELKSRNSIPVYRWPEKLPNNYNSLTAIGLKSICEVVNHCEGIEQIRLGSDGTKILPETVLTLLLKRNVDCLKKLDFLCWEIEEFHIALILTYTYGLLLNIKLHKFEDITKNGLLLLIDNRELLKGFLIECIEFDEAIICYPDTRTCKEILLPDIKSMKIFCPGVNSFKMDAIVNLTNLTIKQASKLTGRTLKELSNLKSLRHFHIEDLNLVEILSTQLANIFNFGFKKLYSLGMINCRQVDDSVIGSIVSKSNLRQLNIDLRQVQHPKVCLNSLKSLKQLINLKLLLIHSNNDVQLKKAVNKRNWLKLKTISVLYYYPSADLPVSEYHYGKIKLNKQRLYQCWET